MITRAFSYISIAIILVIASLLSITTSVNAANVSWDGEGTDNNFSTAANWAGDTIPVDGDVIIFDSFALSGDVVYNNDLTDLDVAGLSITGINPGTHTITITGNPLTLSGNVNIDQDNSVYLALTLILGTNAVLTVPSGADLYIGDQSNVGLYDLDMQSHTLTISSDTGCGLPIYSSLKGSGMFNVSDASSGVILEAAADTFSGAININDGTLAINNSDAITGTSLVTVNSGGTLGLGLDGSDRTYATPITFNSGSLNTVTNRVMFCAGGFGSESYTATLTGVITLLANTQYTGDSNTNITGTYTPNSNTFTIASGVQGQLTTPQGTIKPTALTTTINSGDNQPATPIYVTNNQTYIVNGERGDAYINPYGTLKGLGTVAGVYLFANGTLAPGLSPGILNTGNLTFTGGTLEIELGGTTPGNATTNHDQLDVTGTVDLGSATTLETTHWNGFRPVLNSQFVIINNDGTDAVTGTFQGLADGATFTVDSITYTISYDGGDGNDVVLTATNVPTTATVPDTGFAQLSNPLVVTVLSILSVIALSVVYKKFAK
jgi:hypothetical protein